MGWLEDAFVGIISLILCIMNVVAIAIILLETEGNNSGDINPIAIQVAEAGIGITMAFTGAYAILYCYYLYCLYVDTNPRKDHTKFECGFIIFLFTGSCILSIVAMAVILIETDKNNKQQPDIIAVRSAEVGIGIIIAITGIYGIYKMITTFGGSGNKQNPYIYPNYYSPTSPPPGLGYRPHNGW